MADDGFFLSQRWCCAEPNQRAEEKRETEIPRDYAHVDGGRNFALCLQSNAAKACLPANERKILGAGRPRRAMEE